MTIDTHTHKVCVTSRFIHTLSFRRQNISKAWGCHSHTHTLCPWEWTCDNSFLIPVYYQPVRFNTHTHTLKLKFPQRIWFLKSTFVPNARQTPLYSLYDTSSSVSLIKRRAWRKRTTVSVSNKRTRTCVQWCTCGVMLSVSRDRRP